VKAICTSDHLQTLGGLYARRVSSPRRGVRFVPFDVHPTTRGGHPVLDVRGELDLLTAPQLAEAVDKALAAAPPLLAVDLSGTTFLDSSGARQLARAARAAARAGTVLQVVCPPENHAVRLVIGLLDLAALVPVLPSPDLIGHDPRP
jgi:anti-anti-sigma factor